MGSEVSNYDVLIAKLDQFTRKYYINQIIRGFLYTAGLVIALFVIFNILEHFYYFDTVVRKIFFLSFIGVSLFSVSLWILNPLFKFFRLGKVISHEKAANIIGQHFPEVQDKLLNVLQLHEQSHSAGSNELIFASIEQKTSAIKPVAFKKAIDYGKNRKYLKYALPPLLILFGLLIASPTIITDSTSRIIRNNEEFEKPAPFYFNITNRELKVVQFEDYNLELEVTGKVLPADVFVEMDNFRYKLEQKDKSTFSYTFKDVPKDINFKISSGPVSTDNQTLEVLKVPSVNDFKLYLDYPSYTGRRDETLTNTGNAILPIGTKVTWSFNTDHTDQIGIHFLNQNKNEKFIKMPEGLFDFSKRVYNDLQYAVTPTNADVPNIDSLHYSLSVIPDHHPDITVEQFMDTLDTSIQFFVGQASDDYGLSDLNFHYTIVDQKGNIKLKQSQSIKKTKALSTNYNHTIDMTELGLNPGDQVEYYFEVFDNDGINGKKSSKTRIMKYNLPSLEELDIKKEQNNEKIKDNLQRSMEELKKVKDELKKLQEKLIQEKNLNWQNKKQLEQLMQKRQELLNQIDQAKDKFEENLQNQQQPSEELKEKQENLQELFEEMRDPEMDALMEKIKELMDQLEKENALEMIEEMEKSDDELDKDMDRMLELFKTLEVEQAIEEMIEKLEDLAKKEEELSNETKEEKKSKEELIEKQEELKDEFEKLQEDMEDLQKKNEELERPKDIGDDPEDDMENIEKDLENSQDQLEKQEKKKASKSQKNASDKMKQMASNMKDSMAAGEMEQMDEDLKALRQLLENLVQLSFNQEDLILNINKAKVNTPNYVSLVQNQYKLKDDFKIVEDSLQALSKRVDKIQTFITDKVYEVNDHLKTSITNLEDRKKAEATSDQQHTMKNLNDLAVMLSEVMQQMQEAMANKMPGNQSCEKPGGKGQGNPKDGKKPKDKMSGKQGELNKSSEQMKQSMKNGMEGSAEDFAKMAKRQGEIREALKAMDRKNKQQGKGDPELQKIIDEMNKIETELVNKRLSNETLKRQQDIMTRLLKSENAERQRELDNKRKSESARERQKVMPPALIEYLKKKESEVEQFNKVSPALRPFYKQLVEEYLRNTKLN